MKRLRFLKFLRKKRCELWRESSRHTLFWSPENQKTATVPRHSELNDYTVKGICRGWEISQPDSFH